MTDVFSIYSGACLVMFAVGYAAGAALRALQQIAETATS